MSDQDVHRALAEHLARISIGRGWADMMWFRSQAQAILHDPQLHVEALVAAGVLERNFHWGGSLEMTHPSHRNYRVRPPKPPHKHEWFCIDIPQPSELQIACACGESRVVLNQIPIEAPNA